MKTSTFPVFMSFEQLIRAKLTEKRAHSQFTCRSCSSSVQNCDENVHICSFHVARAALRCKTDGFSCRSCHSSVLNCNENVHISSFHVIRAARWCKTDGKTCTFAVFMSLEQLIVAKLMEKRVHFQFPCRSCSSPVQNRRKNVFISSFHVVRAARRCKTNGFSSRSCNS